jgi:hypothetical protein
MIANQWLTALQSDFLIHFFATEASQHFFLTGGTALAAFYLHHRASVDLDLFTLDDLALREAESFLPRLAKELKCQISSLRRTENFCQLFLENAAGPLKIDLVCDFGPQYGEHLHVASVIVDSLENIAVNKLTAILERTEPKDFVDLHFILQAGYDFDDLLAKAQTKDLGAQPFFVAGALLQVRNLRLLPATTPPLTPAALEASILPLVDRLLDEVDPTQHKIYPELA